ncbi:MAG: hypothetical protein U9R37_01710 [Campylobacterota bacterium]|nr:hypothetical protein [Campylobacterota bacterium]
MQKITGKSMNIVNENILKLKEIFPEVFSEDKEDYGLEDMIVVIKDGSFENSVVKTNALQILKQNDINEVVSV